MIVDILLTLLCLTMMVGFSRHWIAVTRRLKEEQKDARLKTHLNWKRGQNDPILGSTAPGSAINRY